MLVLVLGRTRRHLRDHIYDSASKRHPWLVISKMISGIFFISPFRLKTSTFEVELKCCWISSQERRHNVNMAVGLRV